MLRRIQPDRGKIDMSDDDIVHYWCKHLGVTRPQLQQVIDKVGNSVQAVERS